MESLICSFCLSVAARKIVWADPSLRYSRMLLGRFATNNNHCHFVIFCTTIFCLYTIICQLPHNRLSPSTKQAVALYTAICHLLHSHLTSTQLSPSAQSSVILRTATCSLLQILCHRLHNLDLLYNHLPPSIQPSVAFYAKSAVFPQPSVALCAAVCRLLLGHMPPSAKPFVAFFTVICRLHSHLSSSTQPYITFYRTICCHLHSHLSPSTRLSVAFYATTVVF